MNLQAKNTMKNILKKICNNKTLLFEILIFWTLSFYSINWLFSYFEKSRWVNEYIYYRGVQSTEEDFEIYKDITFASDSVVYETIDVTWQDILRCDFHDWLWYRYYSYYESKAKLTPKDYTSIWAWQWEKPLQKSSCYLDWLVVVNTDNGNRKTLHVTSNIFTVWAK